MLFCRSSILSDTSGDSYSVITAAFTSILLNDKLLLSNYHFVKYSYFRKIIISGLLYKSIK